MKVDANLEQDFPGLSLPQKQQVLLKLQRYIDRGKWAQGLMDSLAPSVPPHELPPELQPHSK